MTLWRAEIDAIRSRSKTKQNSKNLIAFYGSSSLRLWSNMEKDLAPHHVLNLGFGGSTYRTCNYFFEKAFEFVAPSEIVLYAGDNDLGLGGNIDDILLHFNALIHKIVKKYPAVHLSVISIKPSPNRLYLIKEINTLNTHFIAMIKELKRSSYIDIHSKMLHEDGSLRPELYLEDELHLNLKGYEIWKHVLKQHLDYQKYSWNN
ncbi:MAG: GDSL-type esterase/lipase family protein [Bacteroidota bacterium]